MAAARAILHVDMDAFFASIEQLDDPKLRGRPVLVGGAGPRGVVAAASYESRPFGCRSAQPMAVARRLCPQAVIVPPRGGRYREVSRRVFGILESFTPVVEPLSIDEAFLDVTGSRRLLGPAEQIAAAIKVRIGQETGLTCSVGVAPNKFLAKLASEMDKPDGLTVLQPPGLEQRLAAMPVGRMWGVGPATERRLRALGIETFGDLARWPPEALGAHVGVLADRICRLARGGDDRRVVPDSRAKSVSHEQTFGADLADPEAVTPVLLGQVEQVAERLRRHDWRAGSAAVKIRFGDFQTITRSRRLPEPTDGTARLWPVARELFGAWAAASFQPVRLIGFAAGQLVRGGEQLGLFTQRADERAAALDRAADEIRRRFGPGAIHRGAARHGNP